MGTPLRKVFQRITCLATSWRRNTSHHNRRNFDRDVEQEFQYGNSHCLSSYYSVFVARLAIMVMLAILIGLLTILTWHFTKSYTKESLDSLAYGLRHELLRRPILRMWSILNSTAEITAAQVKLSEYVIQRYSKPTTQAEQVELYEAMRAVTWALFASHKALNAITINYRNGFVQAFQRDHKTNNTFYIFSDLANYSISTVEGWVGQSSIHGNTSAIWYREPLDPVTGQKLGKASQIPPDDLINIAGISQIPDGVATWHVTVSKNMNLPMLSAALPVFGPSSESTIAVVGVTTALYSVCQLMKELVEYNSGHIYLTSQEGYLLASSANAPLLRNSTRGSELMMAADSEDFVIRSGAEWLQRTYGSGLPPSHEVHADNVKLGNQLYYVDSFFLNLKRLPLVGVLIIPRQYIMGKVDERAFKTLIILICASLCILVIGCVCILILTNGVSKEMKLRAELISQLDARRRAEASSNYKSQFLANMSHELRTPMAAVIGLLDILISDDRLTNEQYASVTQIRKCSTALLRLLNNILDLSKVEAGKLVLEEAEFDLGRELEGLVDMFSVQRINHNVETVLDLSDDMPKIVRGDSARVVQIFANLISNSIKFTTSGHIVLRGWCKSPTTFNDTERLSLDQSWKKIKQQEESKRRASKKDKTVTLWFEIDDTGCGIEPSKWESVFESFEQADPSTTRTHGGTGLGLCIVRTLVNKMGGEIKVVKKEGPGTLMRLYLVLNTPIDGVGNSRQLDFGEHNVALLLAMHGTMSRSMMSQWLHKIGFLTFEASEWEELLIILQKVFEATHIFDNKESNAQDSQSGSLRATLLKIEDIRSQTFIIIVDTGILDLKTDTWKEQLNFLEKYSEKAKFAWILNHDTPGAIKMELRRKGHLLMVNKPLYKAKVIHILEAVMKEKQSELQKSSNTSGASSKEGDFYECLEIDSLHPGIASSEESDISVMGNLISDLAFQVGENKGEMNPKPSHSQCQTVNNSLVELTSLCSEGSNSRTDDPCHCGNSSHQEEGAESRLLSVRQESFSIPIQFENSESERQEQCKFNSKVMPDQKSLQGLRILLAEDTPILQRVATIMLEKMGATVIAVGDGQQAVEALNSTRNAKACGMESPVEERIRSQTETSGSFPFDLILMDCQMPKMDGYEATKTIRKSEAGTGVHIPIVALTAHAMSSDEAKCLAVGMDAYLTKPIDYKLMVSTILSLTKRTH